MGADFFAFLKCPFIKEIRSLFFSQIFTPSPLEEEMNSKSILMRIAIGMVMLLISAYFSSSEAAVHLIHNATSTDYVTIQDAVNAAVDGDTVSADAGTYVEQVTITAAITLQGAGSTTIIEAPDYGLQVPSPQNSMKGNFRYPVLDLRSAVPGSGTITVRNLTIDGRYQGATQAGDPSPYLNDMAGIATYDTNALIENVSIHHIAAPLDGLGNFEGITRHQGILAEGSPALGATIVTVTITDCTIDTFQKAGINAWGSNLNVIITDNHITGAGVQGRSGQNGIQIGSFNLSRPGTTATISGNIIDNLGAPDDLVATGYVATGIYPVTAGAVEAFGNTVTLSPGASANSLIGIDVGYGLYSASSGPANLHNNIFNGMLVGIQVDSPSKTVVHTFSYNILTTVDGDPIVYWYDPLNNGDTGGETIAGFGVGRSIRVVGENFTSGTLTAGDGSAVAPNSVQFAVVGGNTILYIDSSVANGSATPPLTITLQGIYRSGNFVLDGEYIRFNSIAAVPTINEWGMILFMLMAGIGSVYFIRKQKRAIR